MLMWFKESANHCQTRGPFATVKEEDRESKFQFTVHAVCVWCVRAHACIDLGQTDKLVALRNSLAVQWLGLCTSAAMGLSSISGSLTGELRSFKLHRVAQKKGGGVLPQCVLVAQSCLTLVISCVMTVAYPAPLSMEFSRQEYWSRQPFPSPGHLPNPGIDPRSPALQADSLLSEPPGKSIALASNFLELDIHKTGQQLGM